MARGDILERIAQGCAKGLSSNLEDIAVFRLDAIGHGERCRSEVMDMQIARPTEAVILEVVIFEVGQSMAHIGFACQEGLLPDRFALAQDAAHALDRGGDLADKHLRPDCRMAEL